MRNLVKMDLRRMRKTPLFYGLLLGLVVMVGTFGFTGVMGENDSTASLFGPVNIAGDMMSTMGISLTLIFGAVYVVSVIGIDFSTGFIKNILTIYANKKEYILSKLIIGTIASVIMIISYMILMTVIGLVQGFSLGIPSVGGFLMFLIGKVLLAMALNALCIGFMITFRNLPISIIACFMFGMGGVTMMLNMLGNSMGVPVLNTIASFTIPGANGVALVNGTVGGFLHTFMTAIVWLFIMVLLGCTIMKKKDV